MHSPPKHGFATTMDEVGSLRQHDKEYFPRSSQYPIGYGMVEGVIRAVTENTGEEAKPVEQEDLTQKKTYTAPKLTEWGSVTQLTATGIKGQTGDGVTKFSITPPGLDN
jgi:hypothetical protein